ncbi:hypothetical protein D3C72_2292160 [compost metagenome]
MLQDKPDRNLPYLPVRGYWASGKPAHLQEDAAIGRRELSPGAGFFQDRLSTISAFLVDQLDTPRIRWRDCRV